ncbi:unnamed protein product [Schistosoma margrebowiei]|uniref:Homeobox domain-containing protein n=1 Tax=Schistosoma margrebowiei TaxID=48269 RepID=A0AA85AK05_9TREM|nr:unnamed protein product [Schistosoma margrebowiei]
MFELKILRHLSEPPFIQLRQHTDESDRSTSNSLSRDLTFNTDQKAQILTMPISLYRRKYLQKVNQWVKDTTIIDNTTDKNTNYLNNTQVTSQSTTHIDHHQQQLDPETTNNFISSSNYNNCSKYYLLKSNHQLEMIQSMSNSTHFFFTLASQIQPGTYDKNGYRKPLWTHREQSNGQRKEKLKQTRELNRKQQTKEMQSFNIADNKHPIHDAVYDSSSNFLLHCMTIDECLDIGKPNTISSSFILEEDNGMLTRTTSISEMMENDTTAATTTTNSTYECIRLKKRKTLNIPNCEFIPKQINRYKFHKHRKYVNQPFKLTTKTTTTTQQNTLKRPDPFA